MNTQNTVKIAKKFTKDPIVNCALENLKLKTFSYERNFN